MMKQTKISDLLKELQKREEKFTSFEVFPDDSLKIEDFKCSNINIRPLFYSVAWKISNYELSPNIDDENILSIPSIKLLIGLKNMGEVVMLHLTCVGMKKVVLRKILDYLKKQDIKNLLILKGDKAPDKFDEDFNFVSQMITFVKQNYRDYFCIGIAGLPNSSVTDLKYVKEKVSLGANFIITQIFFKSDDLITFVDKCRSVKIDIPIIPGICLFTSYKSLVKMAELTKVTVPSSVFEKVQDKTNDEVTKTFNDIYTEILRDINENSSIIPGIHWFTMNKFEAIIKLHLEYNTLK